MSTGLRRAILAGAVVLVAVIAVVVVVLRGGDDAEVAEPVTTSTTQPEITTTTEPDTGPVAPLTGLRLTDLAAATRPALAVKVDNLSAGGSATALPQAGLARADVVIEEIVEGNITRLIAVYQSQAPGRVGPVRSARTTDVHLLPQLGRTLLAWSGGNQGVTAAVRDAPSIVDLGVDRATGSYHRDRERRAPHNLFVEADELWDLAPADLTAPDPLFDFREDDQPNPSTARSAQGVDITWGGGAASSPVTWRWNPDLRLYVRTQRGEPHVDVEGTQISAQNVVVLLTPYGQSPADVRSPEALTVGRGEALVFTNGGLVEGWWERPSEDVPARLLDAELQPVLLTPGQTWIQLPRPGEATVVD